MLTREDSYLPWELWDRKLTDFDRVVEQFVDFSAMTLSFCNSNVFKCVFSKWEMLTVFFKVYKSLEINDHAFTIYKEEDENWSQHFCMYRLF